MVSTDDVVNTIKKARELGEKKKFNQSVELVLALKDIDVKKGFALNEVVNLPHPPSSQANLCVIASGDLALRARKAEANRVIEPEELEKIGASKREAKKLARSYDFFIADTSVMPAVGKTLGQFLGPMGKMATPLPFNAPVENILDRFRKSVRVRAKGQLMAACKIGDETMDDKALAENAQAVLAAVEKKLPGGDKNVRAMMVKLSMGKVAKAVEAKVA
jgi:large subunit ribosomal protein L1